MVHLGRAAEAMAHACISGGGRACREHHEKAPAGVARRTLPSESSKGTVTSDSQAAVMHAASRHLQRGDSLSLPGTCSAEWAPKISTITHRVANQYKARTEPGACAVSAAQAWLRRLCAVQVKAVQEVLKQRRTAFVVQVAEWQQAMKLYVESAKLDQMRVRLLQEAGIPNVKCQVLRPLRPCMRVVASTSELKELLLLSYQFVLQNARQKALLQREKQDEELRQFLQRRQDLATR